MKSSKNRRWIVWVMMGLIGCCPLGVLAQQTTTTEQTKAVDKNAKAAAVTGRAPGLWIQKALGGVNITQTQAEHDQPTRLQGVYVDLLNLFFTALNTVIPLLPTLFQENGQPAGVGDLVITEVANDGTNSFVEIYNPSGLQIQLDNWAFCKVDQCTGEKELEGRVMTSNSILVFQLGGTFDSSLANGVVTLQVGTTADEIGLYDFTGATSRNQLDRVSMVDYVKWGNPLQTLGLEDVATVTGWLTQTSIDSRLQNDSFQLARDHVSTGGRAENYIVVPFTQNSLGQLTPDDLTAAASSATASSADRTPSDESDTGSPQQNPETE